MYQNLHSNFGPNEKSMQWKKFINLQAIFSDANIIHLKIFNKEAAPLDFSILKLHAKYMK